MSDSHLHLYPHRKGDPLPPPPPDRYSLDHIGRYVDQAARRDVSELTFTEHLYRCVESVEALGNIWERASDPRIRANTKRDLLADRTMSLQRYVEVILAAQDAGLPVLLGLEVDFFPDNIDAVLQLIEPYPWDVLIGSIHWIDGWWFDRSDSEFEWERLGPRRVYERYFEVLAEMAVSGKVDVITHPDRVKYLRKPFPTEPTDLYATFLTAAQQTDVTIEINTGGLRHPVHEIYPSPTFIRMIHEAGLPITFASDAHAPEQAAWGLDLAREEAAEAGFTHRARFVGRHRTLVPFTIPPPSFAD
ncbi:MAG: histidinol-phosphatase [Acidimicrobiia bacterium]|nr:histidinol-phosphatase [Acidimicrobiia bacterium]